MWDNIKTNSWNYDGVDIWPHSTNYRDTVLKWSGTDSEENFKKQGNRDYAGVDIEYKLNTQGFRSQYHFPYMEGKEVNIALGCSFTEGIGLLESETWPMMIEEQTPIPMLNCGLGGASSDTVARILTGIVNRFTIQTVFILWPPIARFEFYNESEILSKIPEACDIEHVWNLDEFNSIQRFNKNQAIVRMLSNLHKFRVIEQRAEPLMTHYALDMARDNQHAGKKTHQVVAANFLDEL